MNRHVELPQPTAKKFIGALGEAIKVGNRENFSFLFENDTTITYSVGFTPAMPRNSNYEAELSCRSCLIAAGTFGSCDSVFIPVLVYDSRLLAGELKQSRGLKSG